MKLEIKRTASGTARFARLFIASASETLAEDQTVLFNGNPDSYQDRLFVLSGPWAGESHTIGVLWAEHAQDAWDEAADCGMLDLYLLTEEQAAERDEHEVLRLGNASQPFELGAGMAVEVPYSDWQADYYFVLALGRSMENCEISSAAEL